MLHLHHVQPTSSHPLNGSLRNPQMVTIQQLQLLNMEGPLRTLQTNPDTVLRPNPAQFLSNMSQPLPHNMNRQCKNDQGTLSRNSGPCMVGHHRMDLTNHMNPLKGRWKIPNKCNSNQGILAYKELIGRVTGRLFLRLFRAHKVNSMLRGETRRLRTNLARYLAVLEGPELWAFLVH
jgi:hypothetical protein